MAIIIRFKALLRPMTVFQSQSKLTYLFKCIAGNQELHKQWLNWNHSCGL